MHTADRSTAPTRRRHSAALAWLLVPLLLLAGCISAQDIRDVHARSQVLQASLAGQVERLEALHASTPPEHPLAGEIAAQLHEARAVHSIVAAATDRLDGLIAEAESPSDPITHTIGALAPWLPEPARAPALLAAAALAGLVRARQVSAAMGSVVRGLERAMKDDPEFSQAFRRHAATFRATQTPLAQRLVDREQARRREG